MNHSIKYITLLVLTIASMANASANNTTPISISHNSESQLRAVDLSLQQAYIKASNTGEGDRFGNAVASYGNTLVIGAVLEDSDATGVNNDQDNDNAPLAGAVYVYVYDENGWQQQAYIKASNTNDWGNSFGRSVSIYEDTLVVGMEYERSGATGINGDQTDLSAQLSGAAYVFTRADGIWSQQAYVKASNTDEFDLFGGKVAVYENTMAVAARGEGSNSTGINGNQSNNEFTSAGAVYVFERVGDSWSQKAYIKASNTGSSDLFGWGMGLYENTLIVGARGEASAANGVNGDQSDDSSFFAGAAYVFTRENGTWSQQAYLKASNSDSFDQFGASVALDKDTVVVGARQESGGSSGINGNQEDQSLFRSGAVYVFVRNKGEWVQQAYIKASNPDEEDLFGTSLAVQNQYLAVGAVSESSAFDSGQNDNSQNDSGAVYLFERVKGNWQQIDFLKASNAEAGDEFGFAVALNNDQLMAGARFEQSNAVGINGDQSDNSFDGGAGAVYVYDIDVDELIFATGFE